MSAATHPFDQITPEWLEGRGSMKWTRFPGTLPGFVAEMDFPLAPPVKKALQTSVDSEQFGYLPQPVADEMKQTTSGYLARTHGWSVEPSQIHPTGDVLQAYEIALRKLVTPGSPVVIPTPAYMPFLTLTTMVDHPVIEVPMVADDSGRPQMDLEAIATHLEGEAEMVVLCNPHNPLGLVYTDAELRALSEVAEKAGAVVFSDEIHAPLVFGTHRHIPYATVSEHAAEHSITAISASKAWNLPGLKCAQLVVTSSRHKELLDPVAFIVSQSAATPGVLATTAAYRDGGAWLDDVREYLSGNFDLLDQFTADHFPGSGYRRPEGTYIVWLDARGIDIQGAESPTEFLREHTGVSLTDGARCGEAGKGHLRLIAATPRPILQEILERIAPYWQRTN